MSSKPRFWPDPSDWLRLALVFGMFWLMALALRDGFRDAERRDQRMSADLHEIKRELGLQVEEGRQ